jgi:hypothetical protein
VAARASPGTRASKASRRPILAPRTHIARGPQDTRSHQAGGTETGLGTPETGANQTPADLEHRPAIGHKH